MVQRRRLETHADPNCAFAYPRIHGLVFDPADGILHRLPMNFKEQIADLSPIYDLFEANDDHYMLKKTAQSDPYADADQTSTPFVAANKKK